MEMARRSARVSGMDFDFIVILFDGNAGSGN
jgi:hypothetical protein